MAGSISGASGTGYNRISGMMSGLDTESIVKQMTAADQFRIDRAMQQKQLLTWKRDSYREITAKLAEFKSMFFGPSGSLLTGALNKTKLTNSAPQYASVTASDGAARSNIIIRDIVSLASAAKTESSTAVSAPLTMTVDTGLTAGLAGKSLKVTLDGESKILTFTSGDYSTAINVKTALQSMIDGAFGAGRVNVTESGGTLTFNAGTGVMTLSKSGIAGSEASGILGFTDGGGNRINIYGKLSDIAAAAPLALPAEFTVNGVPIAVDGTKTMREIMNAVNSSAAGVIMSYSSVTDKFTFTSAKTGAGTQVVLADTQGTFIGSIVGAGVSTAGTNAEIKINTAAPYADPSLNTYQTVVRSSNTFELDGVTYSLNGMAEGTAFENVAVSIASDTDASIEAIKNFVNKYNETISLITGRLAEKRFRDFPPLTDAQKKEMSESEIEMWTGKAKSGLLSGDSLLGSISGAMRSALYGGVQNASLMLTDIGISTGTYTEKGKLTIDEAKLRKALTERPEDVMQLLSQKSTVAWTPTLTADQKTQRYNESGLFSRIGDIIENSIRQSGVKGSLIQVAGNSTDKYETANVYNDRIRSADETIAKLTDQLSRDQERYWAKFTALEKAMSTLNSQSSWISQQMNSMNNGG